MLVDSSRFQRGSFAGCSQQVESKSEFESELKAESKDKFGDKFEDKFKEPLLEVFTLFCGALLSKFFRPVDR